MKLCLWLLILVVSLYATPSLTIAVTLQPYAKILSKIGGERVKVISLIPQGTDPHTFEPKPATLKDFSKASIYFTDGSLMDKNWLPRFKGVNQSILIVPLNQGIHMEKTECNHEHHHEESLDPHLWTSIKNVKIIANNMFLTLVSADSLGKNYFEKNFKDYIEELDELSNKIEKVALSLSENQKTFLVFHPSFGYFARDYGFKQLSVEVNGKEPKPKDLKKIIQVAKESQVETIFVMPGFSKRSAEMVASSIQGTVSVIDPLAYNFEKSIELILESLLENKK